MKDTIKKLWPELEWIENKKLRDKTAVVWKTALEKSVLSSEDLHRIPFTLLASNVHVSFMQHKRAVVHMAKSCGEHITEFLGSDLHVDMDVLIAGAILCDVGKLLEYELENGKPTQSSYGQYVRHPFSGVALAEQQELPPAVTHIIAAHAKEGDGITRSVEAYIVHHCDFMSFLPFKERLKIGDRYAGFTC